MMNFRIAKDALVKNVLGPASETDGTWRTVGYQVQSKNADESKRNARSVQAYYKQGDFPSSGGANHDVTQHKIQFELQLTVSAPSVADLTVLQNPNATATQIRLTLDQLKNSSQLADELFDELVENVYQVVMDARNYDLGLAAGIVSGRFISSVQKDDPVPVGKLTTLTGTMTLVVQVEETVLSEEPLQGVSIDDDYAEINGDTTQKTGVETTP
jgi:hypothetical protein